MSNQKSNQIRENTLSICRLAWTSNDMQAYRHLHLQKKTIQDYFIRTQGFANVRDLRLVEDR